MFKDRKVKYFENIFSVKKKTKQTKLFTLRSVKNNGKAAARLDNVN